MHTINNLIMAIEESGAHVELYSTINTVALCISLLVGLLNGVRLRAGIIATIVTVAVEYLLSGPIVSAIVFLEDGFRFSGRANGAYIFVYIPLLGYLVSLIVKKSYKQIWDTMMVIPLTMFAGARIACTITGCCRGYPSDWGVYNPITGSTHIPVQLLETLFSVVILVYVFWREKKNNYIPDGRNVPIILIAYGVARFLSEFLHADPRLWIFTWMQFHCVLMIVVGFITLQIIKRSERKEAEIALGETAG